VRRYHLGFTHARARHRSDRRRACAGLRRRSEDAEFGRAQSAAGCGPHSSLMDWVRSPKGRLRSRWSWRLPSCYSTTLEEHSS
jgi:hypothetical protein